MRKIVTTVTAVFFLLIFLVPQAHALKAVLATIISGHVEVIGTQAKKNANITWEGNFVSKANAVGSFQFNTTDLPSDCVGTLSDGINTSQVVVNGCGPVVKGSEVLATGQTTCDTSGVLGACPGNPAGQDGELQKGAARSYTDNGDGTITDNATGLMWEKLTNPGDSSIHDWNNFYTWAQAFAKIAALNTANFAGHNDWRLPNVNEFQTLADYGLVNPAIDTAFNNGTNSFTQSSDYWSSTSYALLPSLAWYVAFDDGTVGAFTKAFNFYVRAVRGGS